APVHGRAAGTPTAADTARPASAACATPVSVSPPAPRPCSPTPARTALARVPPPHPSCNDRNIRYERREHLPGKGACIAPEFGARTVTCGVAHQAHAPRSRFVTRGRHGCKAPIRLIAHDAVSGCRSIPRLTVADGDGVCGARLRIGDAMMNCRLRSWAVDDAAGGDWGFAGLDISARAGAG